MTPDTIFVLATAPGQNLVCASGNVYTANAQGFLTIPAASIPAGDKVDLLNMGCLNYAVAHVGHAVNISLSYVGDQPIPVRIPNGIKFRVNRVIMVNADAVPTAVTGNIYSAPEQEGVLIADLDNAIKLTSADIAENLTLLTTNSTVEWGEGDDNNFYLNITVPSSVSCTVDIYVYADVFWPFLNPVGAGSVWDSGASVWDKGASKWDKETPLNA
jgi:hypothetical protein